MTREDKIKEAWKETGIVPVFYDCVMCNMGWAKFDMKIKNHIYYKYEKFHFCGLNWFRPKSLDGIDNNNGWIKIDSEEELPKVDFYTKYWLYDGESKWIHTITMAMKLGKEKITHFQPIPEPKPPIF